MYNILIDGLPDNYKGYKIRTSYKIGVLLTLMLEDDSVDEDYKMVQAISILYEDEPEDKALALEGVSWFLSCGENEVYYVDKFTNSTSSGKKALDFNYDSLEVFGTLRIFGIKLSDETHWFEFMSYIRSLPECPLTQKIGYRTMDLTKFKGKMRAEYAEVQDRVAVHRGYTKEEYEEIMKQNASVYGSYYEKLLRLNSGG